jgi:uncharacterized membrane protein
MDVVGAPAGVLATIATWVIWVGAIVLIGRAVVAGLRGRDPAIDALRDRYARGEIDEAEYERLRSTLQRG